MVKRYGLWPGVVVLLADAELYCVPCAKLQYGAAQVQAVIEGRKGYEHYTDHEGNPLTVVLYGSEDLHGMACGRCGVRLCDETCWCYNADAMGVMR